jgi:hypothetical protein
MRRGELISGISVDPTLYGPEVLAPEYASLFTDDEREIARRRLEDYGYSVEGSHA